MLPRPCIPCAPLGSISKHILRESSGAKENASVQKEPSCALSTRASTQCCPRGQEEAHSCNLFTPGGQVPACSQSSCASQGGEHMGPQKQLLSFPDSHAPESQRAGRPREASRRVPREVIPLSPHSFLPLFINSDNTYFLPPAVARIG